MKLQFHGASYDYSPRSFVDTDESETIVKFRGNTYKMRRSVVVTPNPIRNLKYRDLKYRGVTY
jgi:hypothetical protein